MRFDELGLHETILRAVEEEGYLVPTPIQEQAIPHILAGRDILGSAQTGTGKTAAFALPILHHLITKAPAPSSRVRTRALILTPTRELAAQIGESFATYGKYAGLKTAVLFGGVNQNPQVKLLIHGVDIIVATPGRLIDLIDQGWADVKRVEKLVLDEADTMLDMGFIQDMRKIISKTPQWRHTMLFSATMPHEIRALANSILTEPVSVAVAAISSAAETVEQSVIHVDRQHKSDVLVDYLRSEPIERVLVFTKMRSGADRVARDLNQSGIRAEAIHSDKIMSTRTRIIAAFKGELPPVLVATDIAARGLDIDNVSHVVNYDIPIAPEAYVHRIGRTGRAGASGKAVSLCGREERRQLQAIERLIRRQIPQLEPSGHREAPVEARTHSHGHAKAAGHAAAPSPSRPAVQVAARSKHQHRMFPR